jgi:hypothetical protein
MSISWCFRKRDIYFSGTSCPHQSAKFFRDISITHVTEPSSRDCALLQLITPRAAQQSCFKISMDTYLFAPGKSQCIFQIGNTITNITTTETLFYNIDILFWRIVSALPFHWRRHQWLQLCIKNIKNFAVYIASGCRTVFVNIFTLMKVCCKLGFVHMFPHLSKYFHRGKLVLLLDLQYQLRGLGLD